MAACTSASRRQLLQSDRTAEQETSPRDRRTGPRLGRGHDSRTAAAVFGCRSDEESSVHPSVESGQAAVERGSILSTPSGMRGGRRCRELETTRVRHLPAPSGARSIHCSAPQRRSVLGRLSLCATGGDLVRLDDQRLQGLERRARRADDADPVLPGVVGVRHERCRARSNPRSRPGRGTGLGTSGRSRRC